MPSTARPTDLSSTISSLTQNVQNNSHSTSKDLLSRAKVALLKEAALKPHPQTPTAKLHAAQQVFELGALAEIRLTDPAAFTRYYDQLQPFYHYQTSTNANATPLAGSQRSKITGLYLLLLLSQGDYAGFHTVIETLEAAGNDNEGSGAATIKVEEDENIQYPMRLQQWLMEGSYDRVWKETQGDRVPSDEFRLFSDVGGIPPFSMCSLIMQCPTWTAANPLKFLSFRPEDPLRPSRRFLMKNMASLFFAHVYPRIARLNNELRLKWLTDTLFGFCRF